ncbi:MAG TPA: hypothetical protein PK225_11565 [Azonexus sp.]|jgi:hypothetical protein|nr:hypothetical protein [Azonexus sp.]
MNTTKITAKIHPALWDAFGNQCDALFLKKGAFLDHMIRKETVHLARDLAGKRLSNKARRYIAGELKRCGPVTVNIEVAKETAEALNTVVADLNIVRDTFINRLIMFLRGSDRLLKIIEMPTSLDSHRYRELEGLPTSPMKVMEYVRDDPLYYIRTRLELDDDEGIYLKWLGPENHWTACYLPDRLVPGTDEFLETKECSYADF